MFKRGIRFLQFYMFSQLIDYSKKFKSHLYSRTQEVYRSYPSYRYFLYDIANLPALLLTTSSKEINKKIEDAEWQVPEGRFSFRFVVDASTRMLFAMDGPRNPYTPGHADMATEVLTAGVIDIDVTNRAMPQVVGFSHLSGAFRPKLGSLLWLAAILFNEDKLGRLSIANKLTISVVDVSGGDGGAYLIDKSQLLPLFHRLFSSEEKERIIQSNAALGAPVLKAQASLSEEQQVAHSEGHLPRLTRKRFIASAAIGEVEPFKKDVAQQESFINETLKVQKVPVMANFLAQRQRTLTLLKLKDYRRADLNGEKSDSNDCEQSPRVRTTSLPAISLR
jgi:hypothetical protein